MNKPFSILILTLLFGGCSHNPEAVVGKWRVTDPYYTASFELMEEDGKLVAVVLHYNDGTQRYRQQEGKRKYLARNLTWKNEVYVDAYSGATQTDAPASVTIAPMHADTLEVRYTAGHAPPTEQWIRMTEPKQNGL